MRWRDGRVEKISKKKKRSCGIPITDELGTRVVSEPPSEECMCANLFSVDGISMSRLSSLVIFFPADEVQLEDLEVRGFELLDAMVWLLSLEV